MSAEHAGSNLRWSILDLAEVVAGETMTQTFAAVVELAQLAERRGYHRVWYAEHHNLPAIASAATSVLIAHVAAHTSSIRLGAGGIMLPNHSPLVIAEQFGTLAALYPGRIDLGLGRAPGADGSTLAALRRDRRAADRFPHDVVELQQLLSTEARSDGLTAIPGHGSQVPLYILGSSLFGAQLAAQLGLPYAFASHFAPDALVEAVTVYRQHFRPSASLEAPYLIVGFGVIASDDEQDARHQLAAAQRRRLRRMMRSGQQLSDDEVTVLLDSPAGDQVRHMMRHTAVGLASQVADSVGAFAASVQADEVMLVSPSIDHQARRHTFAILADALGVSPA